MPPCRVIWAACLAGLIGLCALGVPSPGAAQDAYHPQWMRWGFAVGVGGWFPIGSDVAQDMADDEFRNTLTLHLEVFTVDITRFVQIVPFANLDIAGGINEDLLREALNADTVDLGSVDSGLYQLGLGARFFPIQLGPFRPFVAAYAAYSVARFSYTAQADLGFDVPDDLSSFTTSAESHTHEGVALLLGAGLRLDIPVMLWEHLVQIPIILEFQWSKNFWLDLERNPNFEANPALLASRRMNLDYLVLNVSVGMTF